VAGNRRTNLLARQIGLARETGAVEVFIPGARMRITPHSAAVYCRINFPTPGHWPALSVRSTQLHRLCCSCWRWIASDGRGIFAAAGGVLSETCGAIPKLAGGIEPLAAFYPKAAHSLAVAGLERGTFAVQTFVGQCVQSDLARCVELPDNEAKHFATGTRQTTSR